MSGGSLNYISDEINSAARRINSDGLEYDSIPYQLLSDHLRKLSRVLHIVEWAISGDSSPDEAEKEIKQFFGESYKIIKYELLKEKVDILYEQIQKLKESL